MISVKRLVSLSLPVSLFKTFGFFHKNYNDEPSLQKNILKQLLFPAFWKVVVYNSFAKVFSALKSSLKYFSEVYIGKEATHDETVSSMKTYVGSITLKLVLRILC